MSHHPFQYFVNKRNKYFCKTLTKSSYHLYTNSQALLMSSHYFHLLDRKKQVFFFKETNTSLVSCINILIIFNGFAIKIVLSYINRAILSSRINFWTVSFPYNSR